MHPTFAQQIMVLPSSEGSNSQNRSARFGGRNEQTSSFNAQSTVKKESKKGNVENIAPEVNKMSNTVTNKHNNMQEIFESTIVSYQSSHVNPKHLLTSIKTPNFNQFQSTLNQSSSLNQGTSEKSYLTSSHRSLHSTATVLVMQDPHIISSPPPL